MTNLREAAQAALDDLASVWPGAPSVAMMTAELREPARIATRPNGKYTEIINLEWPLKAA